MEAVICSSLQKIFTAQKDLPPESNKLFLFKGEKGNFQLAVRNETDAKLKITVETNIEYKIYRVNEIYSGLPVSTAAVNCTVLQGGKAGYYPDLLTPFSGELNAQKNILYSFWIEVFAEKKDEELKITVTDEKSRKELNASVFVNNNALLPQELIYTDWFHSDCLASYYNVPVFSEDYWRITENFIKNAAEHGINCLLTPLFTPPLDTEIGKERPTVQLVTVTKKGYTYSFDFSLLTKWIETAKRNGIKYFELSHLFTQWGAKAAPKIMAYTSNGYKRIFGWETKSTSQGYMSFLRQFGASLTEYARENGLTESFFVHCSDEPGKKDIRTYKKCAAAIKEYFGEFTHIDALSDYEFYGEGLVKLPVPEEGAIEDFYCKVPELWTYYCCGQYNNELPNRFFAMPGIRTRIIGVLLYKYNCTGFLHWGFNFYFSQYSKRLLDPFTETDAGNAFPSGDSFCVYPGENGEPLPSLREKVFFDALQDMRALKTAEEMTSRDTVLGLIEEVLGDINFNNYPMDENKLFELRKRLFESAI
ncbi:MAG: DUF4091 domain-containing protein [Oscillospiraceae bacterium]|nr:DUF4091 domain-containing protein [Oscillospiraceae bacterium]